MKEEETHINVINVTGSNCRSRTSRRTSSEKRFFYNFIIMPKDIQGRSAPKAFLSMLLLCFPGELKI